VISPDGKDLTCVWRITVSIQKDRFADASLHSWEAIDWSKRLGVTPEELKKAVGQVGTSADAVRKHLGK
jgi:Protein of unknown function (DUF3606)